MVRPCGNYAEQRNVASLLLTHVELDALDFDDMTNVEEVMPRPAAGAGAAVGRDWPWDPSVGRAAGDSTGDDRELDGLPAEYSAGLRETGKLDHALGGAVRRFQEVPCLEGQCTLCGIYIYPV